MSWESTAIGIAAPIAAIAVAAFGYRRSRHVDSVSAQLGMATETRAGQAEMRADRESLINSLQEDNALFRQELKEVRAALAVLQREVNRLYRKYGENGVTPPKGIPPVGEP